MSTDDPNPQGALVAAEVALDVDDIERAEEAACEALSQIRQVKSETGGES